MKKKMVRVSDKVQPDYTYQRSAPMGRDFHPDFTPELTPRQMLELGVFSGKYLADRGEEFPKDWFTNARLATGEKDKNLNYFGVHASAPIAFWREKGWINDAHDPLGWFQWYCRYYTGRRLPDEDARQIKRWRAIRRHIAQIKKNCPKGDLTCRKRQRQALLHWAYDSRKI